MLYESNNQPDPVNNVISLSDRRSYTEQNAPWSHEERRRQHVLERHPAFKRVAPGLLVEIVEVVEIKEGGESSAPSNVIPFPVNRTRSKC